MAASPRRESAAIQLHSAAGSLYQRLLYLFEVQDERVAIPKPKACEPTAVYTKEAAQHLR